MRSIQFSADDLGVHPAIDREIVALLGEGRIQGCSVLISSQQLDLALLKELGKMPNVSIGAHLSLTEGRPLTSGLSAIPWIIAPDGAFHRHWRKLLPQLLRHPWLNSKQRGLIADEWRAQTARLGELAGRVDFLDSHQNVHLLPTFRGVASEVATSCGVAAVRTFIEPVQLAHPLLSMLRLGANSIAPHLRLPTLGLFASGNMTLPSLRLALQSLAPNAKAVVAVHPGKNPHHSTLPGTPPPYTLAWEEESALLRSNEVSVALNELDIRVEPWLRNSSPSIGR